MKFTDAFASEVKAVDLFIYDTDGKLVKTMHDEGERLNTEHFTMTVDLPDGVYDIVAWCGLTADTRYRVSHEGAEQRENLQCVLNYKQEGDVRYTDENLAPLFHGVVRADFSGKEDEQTAHIYLTKNTNTLRVTLHHLDYSDIKAEDFRFYVTDDNVLLRHDNAPVSTGEVIYRPHWTGTAVAALPDGEGSEGTVSITSAIAELSLGRLTTMTSPRLVVERVADNSTVIRIPLNDYLLMAKLFGHKDMPDQEYLDRQDVYSANFFIDDNGNWYKNVIYINAWRIMYQPGDLH